MCSLTLQHCTYYMMFQWNMWILFSFLMNRFCDTIIVYMYIFIYVVCVTWRFQRYSYLNSCVTSLHTALGILLDSWQLHLLLCIHFSRINTVVKAMERTTITSDIPIRMYFAVSLSPLCGTDCPAYKMIMSSIILSSQLHYHAAYSMRYVIIKKDIISAY